MSSANCPPNLQAILYVEVEFMRNGNFPELHTGLNNLYRGELSLGTFFTSPESRDSTTVKDDGLLVDILQNVANELIIPHASETDIDEVSGDHIRRCIRHCRIIVINGNVNNGRERRLTRSSFIAACQNAVSNDRDFVQLRLSTNHLAVNTSQAITYLNWDPSMINLATAMSISPAPAPPTLSEITAAVAGGDLAAELQALRLEVHGVRETLPSVLVGHVITPSQASRIPQVVASVFDSLGLSHNPRKTDSEYVLPQLCGDDWKLSWKWPKDYGDDRSLERTSYHPVAEYLKKLGFVCVDVSEGQCCVEKLLFNADIFTSREDNPMRVRGQRVYLRHRIQGRTDLAVLRRDNHGGYILRNMIKFVVEIKTVYGYQQSQTGCMREAQLQVIGLNAFNTHSSPPVVLSNLAKTHKVVYLDVDSEWRYEIKVQDCNSFAAAIHFADTLSNRKCISQHFSRPTTPDSSD